jgi:hypothetical protein
MQWLTIYGAALSTLAFPLSVWNSVQNWRRNARRLKVTVRIQRRNGPAERMYGSANAKRDVFVDVVNDGHRPVVIDKPRLVADGNVECYMHFIANNVTFPCEIGDGKKVTIYALEDEFSKILRDRGVHGKCRLRSYCDDSSGNTYRGNSIMWTVSPG